MLHVRKVNDKTPASMLNDDEDSQDNYRVMSSKFIINSLAFRDSGNNNCCVSQNIHESNSDHHQSVNLEEVTEVLLP